MPFEWYSKFVLDEKFGFNKSSVGLYIKDTMITFVLSMVFGTLVIGGLYFIMSSVQMWWLYSFLFIFAVIIFAMSFLVLFGCFLTKDSSWKLTMTCLFLVVAVDHLVTLFRS